MTISSPPNQGQQKSWFPLHFRMTLDMEENLDVGSLKSASSSSDSSESHDTTAKEGEYSAKVVSDDPVAPLSIETWVLRTRSITII